MADMINQVMDNVDLSQDNSLTHLLECNDNEQLSNIKHSSYCYADEFIRTNADKINCFSYMSLNCYSLNAKYDMIKILLGKFTTNNCPLQAVSLQETWFTKETDLSSYNIPGYQLLSIGSHASKRGGLAIYLAEHWNYKIVNQIQIQCYGNMYLLK